MPERTRPIPTCPRCRRSTASPFAVAGVCLRCAGERVFAEIADSEPASAVAPSDCRPGAAALPDRIGPYDIIEELGRGGMGYIYAARQAGLGRIVALKVLATRGDLAGLDLRFLREAQTVARLHHPNIVAVYESGRTDGFVYFSMEYLPDGDLGRRLRERPFNATEAATLLEKIASAVATAHAAGVLHRDIKPSNILLDGTEPKLADFGLAAQLETGGDLTAISGILGTPHYLAPEALRGGSAALTVASDVYALGAVLYEVLTGRPPFAAASPAELPNLLATTEPAPVRLLAPAVPRDLETICLKCLERLPARRYATAAALAADLRCFLRAQPIAARPPTPWDRARKYAGRHRSGVTAAGIVAVVLIAATTVSVRAALHARRAERQATADAAAATALSDFLRNDLLAQANPDAQPDRNVTLHAVLDRAAKRIDGRFPGQPLIEADLHSVIGDVYDALGDYPAAQAHLERTLAFRTKLLGPTHRDTLTTLHELAGVEYDLGHTAEALKLASRALVLRKQVLGRTHRDTIESSNLVSLILQDRGQFAQADAIATAAVISARQALPRGDQIRNAAVRGLGGLRYRQYRLAEAESLLRESADDEIAASGADSFQAGTALNDLATVYRQEGKLGEAARVYESVLATRRRKLGSDHPATGIVIGNLAGVYKAQNKLAEAEALQRETVDLFTRTVGRDHPRTLITLGNLADTLRLEKNYEAAAALLTETLERSERVQGATHPTTVNAAGSLGDLFLLQGDVTRAIPLLRRALADGPKAGMPTWKIETLRSMLGLALTKAGATDEGAALLTDSYDKLHAMDASLPAPQRKLVPEAAQRMLAFLQTSGRVADQEMWTKRAAVAP